MPKRKDSSSKTAKARPSKGRKVKASDPPTPTSGNSLSKLWLTLTTKSSQGDCEAFAKALSEEYQFRGILDVHVQNLLATNQKIVSHWIQQTTKSLNPISVHCFGICWSNLATTNTSSINDDVLFPSLHPWMPERYREWYLKRTTNGEVESSKGVKKKKQASKNTQQPFVIKVVENLLEIFDEKAAEEKESNKLVEIREEESGSVHDEEASDNDDDDEKAEDMIVEESDQDRSIRLLIHRSLELLSNMLSLPIPYRTELIAYLQSHHWTVRSKRVQMDALSERLLARIRKWMHGFPVTLDEPVKPLSSSERRSLYHDRAAIVQKLCRRHYDLPDVVFAGVGLLCRPNQLRSLFSADDDGKILKDLLYRMRLIERTDEYSRDFLLEVLEDYLVIEPDPIAELQAIPLYPTETVIWDPAVVPPGHTSLWASPVLSLPTLNTQFISFADYLWRNWELLRSESSYEIRLDLVDALQRLQPTTRLQFNNEFDSATAQVLSTDFAGWARMALPCAEPVKIVQVNKPRLGQKYPSQVLAEVTIDLKPYAESLRREWDDLREYDNLFLVAVDASKMERNEIKVDDANDPDFPKRYGVTAVRGCMVLFVRDEAGVVISDPVNKDESPTGTKRMLQVELDPTQYTEDQASGKVYDSLNVVVRRHGKANNFRSVLESVRSLLTGVGSIPRVIPEWMQAILLGHGSSDQASFQSESLKEFARATAGVPSPDAFFDFCDTFVDGSHLLESLQHLSKRVIVDGKEVKGTTLNVPENCNFRIRMVDGTTAEAVSYLKIQGSTGNSVRFTSRQVEAIRAGLSPGLSLVVGPPGTGKTDVAVQIIASLYHSFPKQRTVIITHSNAALNDIFQKVMTRGDVDERYMIRLGSGERELQTESLNDFTKQGRVDYSLRRRAEILEEVQKLSESLGISGRGERKPDGSPSYTCETAEYFNQHQVVKRTRLFTKSVKSAIDPSSVPTHFPFKDYFNVQQDLSLDQAMDFIGQLEAMFKELAEYRPLELLRLQRQRADYLIMKQAKVVAMTCTHAAIARSSLIKLGFEYDNVIIEEAGQMLEIETFIPLLLQRGELGFDCRLKRVTMLGDHNQLPPVIQNVALARYTNLDQSMFARLIKHQVPCTRLDRQGRARPEIADLYRWRYDDLGDLGTALSDETYSKANAGFHRTLQFVNVDDFDGKGETTPTPYFYQNVGEAEYCVAVFQYMVLIGYSPHKISILTTYNGQKELIQDILRQRCAAGTPLAGVRPGAVATVDQYQGQQNDYVLLSLVRTSAVGHLKDVRRLIVAVSRARLGLYVFCRLKTFADADELRPVFEQEMNKEQLLQLVVGENHPTDRKADESAEPDKIFTVEDVEQMGSIVAQMQEGLPTQEHPLSGSGR